MNSSDPHVAENISAPIPTKTLNDENFPVASRLIPARLRPHIHCFYRCVRVADDIADDGALPPEDKMAALQEIDRALQGEASESPLTEAARDHLESAKETGITIDHARHLLQAFMMDVSKTRYRNWSELINYCRFSAAPVGRYLLDLHGDPGTAKPKTDSLCIALQILNHLQDCQKDYRALDRVYIPTDYLREANASIEMLDAEETSPEMRSVIDLILDRTNALIADAATGPAMISDRGLRLETAVIVAIARKLSRKLRKQDPLAREVALGKVETAFCGVRGIWNGLVRC